MFRVEYIDGGHPNWEFFVEVPTMEQAEKAVVYLESSPYFIKCRIVDVTPKKDYFMEGFGG